jgi:hypothetical protein
VFREEGFRDGEEKVGGLALIISSSRFTITE